MPHIDKKSKMTLQPMLEAIPIGSEGELAYAVTMLMQRFCLNRLPLSFGTINACIGAVRLAADHFSDRILEPYEKQKARENGDVYKDFIRDSGITTLFG